MKYQFRTLILTILISLAGSMLPPAACVWALAQSGGETGIWAGDYLAASPVKMDVVYGYDGAAKTGRYIPVQVILENQEDAPFEGTVSIQAMEADYDIYQYDYPVAVDGNEMFKKSIYIPAGRADVLYAGLKDQTGAELIRKRLKINISSDVAELFVGVLADEPEKLDYLNGVVINYSSIRSKTIHLNKENMPQQAIGLNPLDVLLITDYQSDSLSADQLSAVWEWVKGGGTLLLGTGNRADDVLAPWREELLLEPYAPPMSRDVDMGVEYATNEPGDSFLTMVCADLSLPGGQELISNDQFPVLTSVSKGRGKVGVAAYDFTDIAAFCQNNRSYVEKIFTSLLGEERLNELSSYLYNGNSSEYWSVQNVLNTGDVDKLPNLPLYVAVITIYLVLVGPGAYFLLKKQERRRYYRTAVLGLSLSFAALIYLMGISTRFRDTFFTYATVYDTSEQEKSEYTYINVRTPYNKPYSVDLDASYDIQPITRSYYYDMMPAPKFTGNEPYKVRLSNTPQALKLSVQNVTSFTPKYFALAKREENTEKAGLTGDITLFDGQISGTVTNHYDFPVEKAGILLFGQMVALEGLEPGETKTLDGLPVFNVPLDNSYITAEWLTGGSKYQVPDIEDKDYILALRRTNILLFYLGRYASTYNQEARIVGFGKDLTSAGFLASGDYETYGITMYTSTINVNNRKNGYVYRSALMKPPSLISGQYYASSNAAYGLDPLVLEYSLGNDIQTESLAFQSISEELLSGNRYSGLNQFGGTMYFYNHNTGNYDAIRKGKAAFSSWELEDYLSPGNTLTVKYVFDNVTENNWYISLPMPTVIGRDK